MVYWLGGYSPNKDNLILEWYPPMKKLRVYQSRVGIRFFFFGGYCTYWVSGDGMVGASSFYKDHPGMMIMVEQQFPVTIGCSKIVGVAYRGFVQVNGHDGQWKGALEQNWMAMKPSSETQTIPKAYCWVHPIYPMIILWLSLSTAMSSCFPLQDLAVLAMGCSLTAAEERFPPAELPPKSLGGSYCAGTIRTSMDINGLNKPRLPDILYG